MITTPALWVTFAAMLPLMAMASYTDLKTLKIPNTLVLAVLGVFIVTGLWGLPFDIFLWRLLAGVIVLVIGFVLFSIGAIGGGDAKMAAALAPLVVPGDFMRLALLYAIVTFLMLMVLRLVMQVYRHEDSGWLSVDQLKKPPRERVFPLGLILGLTITIYLGAHTVQSLGVDLGL
jgi:prepilin peptidase CpaA